MKDGYDGENWPFKLKVVELGSDVEGEPESSCIVEHVDQGEAPSGGKKAQLKGLPKLVHDTLATMAPSGTCSIEDLIEGVKVKLPKEGEGRDLRKQNISKAISRSLIPGGYVYMHGEDRISLTNIQQAQDWTDL
jgi:hypothetical protein